MNELESVKLPYSTNIESNDSIFNTELKVEKIESKKIEEKQTKKKLTKKQLDKLKISKLFNQLFEK